MMSSWYACRESHHQHVVTARNCNYSTFNGRRKTYSDYSEVRCLDTGSRWRTKAAYVNDLPDAAVEPTRRRVD